MNCDSVNLINHKEDNLTIQTHNGKIHSNEVASVALLVNYFGRKDKVTTVIRSRNLNPHSDILVDIGEIYDHGSLKYDHHGSDFSEFWKNSEVPLSSTGLIWRHYGKEMIEMYLSENNEEYDYSENYTDDIIEELKDIIYHNIFLEIDAHDNGFKLPFNPNTLNIPNIVSAGNYKDILNDDMQNEKFYGLVNLIGNIFDIKFKEIINSYFNFNKDLEKVQELNLRGDYVIVDEKIPTIFKCLEQVENNINLF